MRNYIVIFSIFLLITPVPGWGQITEEMTLKVIPLKTGNTDSLISAIAILLSENGKMSVDPHANNIIIYDYPTHIALITDAIERLDIPLKQVEVKVLITEVTEAFLAKAGLRTGGVIIPSGAFRGILDLLQQNTQGKITSQMMVKTISNQPAQLQVTQEEILGYSVTRYRKGPTVHTVIREPIGNFLEVLPRVNNNGTIQVTVQPSLSTMEPGHAPVERSIITQVVVKNGDTIAIGNLDYDIQETKDSKTSFLGIPLHRRQTTLSKKVVMFLTTTIVD